MALDTDGSVYDGNMWKLSGVGPDCCLELAQTLECRTVIHDSADEDEAGNMVGSDRFYLVSDDLPQTKWLPQRIMTELVAVLKAGGRVAVMGHNKRYFDQVVWFLGHPDTATFAMIETSGSA